MATITYSTVPGTNHSVSVRVKMQTACIIVVFQRIGKIHTDSKHLGCSTELDSVMQKQKLLAGSVRRKKCSDCISSVTVKI